MPLIKSSSKEAVSKNIKKELDSGKPKDQAVAIALSVRRKALGQKHSVPVKKQPEKKGE